MDYKKAGVDIEAGYKSVELMKKHVKETMRPEVLGGLGGFAGAFDLSAIKNMEEPVLLSGTDGCGTKVKLAFVMDKHDTIGIDAVAMCVNDIACSGGEPLFFLDYIACGKNYPEKIATIVRGVAEGFAVGVVDKKDIINGENIKPGDVLVGIASSGVHSNGFSLVRSVFDITKESLETYYDELGKTLGEALIEPTRIYVKALKNVKNAGVKIKGCSHITGGGFDENIPRMLPDGVKAIVKKDSYKVPAIFDLIAKNGNINEDMMYNTFNMGLGMIIALDPADQEKAMAAIEAAGDTCYVVGHIEEGEKGELTELYQNRIINIHPSLIPAFCGPGFYGLHVHEHAFKRGVKVAGATVHFVSPVVDGGPIILPEAMDVSQARSPEEMQKMVLTIEHRILPEAVRLFCNGQLKVENERVEIL